MAETVFSNLRARGTLVVVGLATLGTAAVTTLTLTTGTITTANITTANIQTLSGATIDMRDSGDLIRASTLSGATLSVNGGGSGKILCSKTDGTVGFCSDAAYGTGVCSCT